LNPCPAESPEFITKLDDVGFPLRSLPSHWGEGKHFLPKSNQVICLFDTKISISLLLTNLVELIKKPLRDSEEESMIVKKLSSSLAEIQA